MRGEFFSETLKGFVRLLHDVCRWTRGEVTNEGCFVSPPPASAVETSRGEEEQLREEYVALAKAVEVVTVHEENVAIGLGLETEVDEVDVKVRVLSRGGAGSVVGVEHVEPADETQVAVRTVEQLKDGNALTWVERYARVLCNEHNEAVAAQLLPQSKTCLLEAELRRPEPDNRNRAATLLQQPDGHEGSGHGLGEFDEAVQLPQSREYKGRAAAERVHLMFRHPRPSRPTVGVIRAGHPDESIADSRFNVEIRCASVLTARRLVPVGLAVLKDSLGHKERGLQVRGQHLGIADSSGISSPYLGE
jgi:hypothetical protein